MTTCMECVHFYQELDTHFQGCKLDMGGKEEIKEEWQEGKEQCPYFEDCSGE